jgi:hypothetical protein
LRASADRFPEDRPRQSSRAFRGTPSGVEAGAVARIQHRPIEWPRRVSAGEVLMRILYLSLGPYMRARSGRSSSRAIRNARSEISPLLWRLAGMRGFEWCRAVQASFVGAISAVLSNKTLPFSPSALRRSAELTHLGSTRRVGSRNAYG